MLETEIAVVGGGPAGMCAAIAAARQGARVTLVDREDRLGGQLVKQTHRFFGSEHEHAGTRGFQIAELLSSEIAALPGINVLSEATALGFYPDRVLLLEQRDRIKKVRAARLVVATGAAEKMLAFPNNDLPGIYGAGAVQTLMNVHGVTPGKRVLMVGAGNIGLIVSYQLLQAGVQVAAVIEAAPRIGGYAVHASKIRRAGIPILTSHTVLEAHGTRHLEGATIARVDQSWQPVAGSERYIEVDVMCLAVGLSPLVELLCQAGCAMRYVPELGGHVAIRSAEMETSVPGVFVAGDAGGVEEASSAMLTGTLAGLAAANSLGYSKNYDEMRREALYRLGSLRAGPVGEKIRLGLGRLAEGGCF